VNVRRDVVTAGCLSATRRRACRCTAATATAAQCTAAAVSQVPKDWCSYTSLLESLRSVRRFVWPQLSRAIGGRQWHWPNAADKPTIWDSGSTTRILVTVVSATQWQSPRQTECHWQSPVTSRHERRSHHSALTLPFNGLAVSRVFY